MFLKKPAFSKDDILPMDLGTFYREFQNPPQLSSLSIDFGAQSMAEDLVWKPLPSQGSSSSLLSSSDSHSCATLLELSFCYSILPLPSIFAEREKESF